MERFGQQTYPSVAERNRFVRLVKIGQKLWPLESGCVKCYDKSPKRGKS